MGFSSIISELLLTQIKLFKFANLSGIGLLQNEGLVHNNSIKIAVWESWQLWSYSQSDVVFSLNTDIPTSQTSALSRMHQIITHDFVPRLWQLFISFLNNQKVWQDLINNTYKNLKSVYHHLNVKLPAEEPAIDNVAQINKLSSILSYQSQNEYLLIFSSLLMISFFFKFKAVSTFSSAEVYFCKGFIHC